MKKFLLIIIIFLSLTSPAHGAFKISSSVPVLTSGLVGRWTMDNKHLNWLTGVVTDFTGTNNGQMIGSISTTTAPTEGKVGQGLKFDGVDDYIALNSNFVNTSQPYTVAGWIKYTGTSRMIWLAKGDHGPANDFIDFEVNHFDGGANTFGMRSFFTGFGNSLEIVYASGLLPNRWQHVAMVRHTTSPNNFSIYINGVSMATSSASQSTPLAANPTTLVRIGARDVSGAVSLPFNGAIDDTRVYNRALSVAEIKTLYNQSAGLKQNTSSSPGGLASGLVGHWTFDGSKLNQNVTDSSGQGNNGRLSGIAATSSAVTEGKIGQALSFDGVDDFINLGNGLTDTGSFSVSLWIKADSATNRMYFTRAGDNNYVGQSTEGLYFSAVVTTSPSNVQYFSTNGTVQVGKWVHLVQVFDNTAKTLTLYNNGVGAAPTNTGSTLRTTSPFMTYIGRYVSGLYTDGALDDVRYYNRALSAAEISALYRMGVPNKQNASASSGGLASGLVGHWTFDGSKLNQNVTDSSGQGNNGKFFGITATSSVVTEGKIGQALRLDGIDDAINVTNFPVFAKTDPFSGSMWVKTTRAPGASGDFPLDTWDYNVTAGWQFSINTSRKLAFGLLQGAPSNYFIGTGDQQVPIGTWTHIVFTYDGSVNVSGVKTYVNGVPDSMTPTVAGSGDPGTLAATTLYIGRRRAEGASHGYLGAVVDDVRIYNRVLSIGEIKALYKMGR